MTYGYFQALPRRTLPCCWKITRTFKNKYYKNILNHVYSNKLDNLANEYNNTYHRATKINPADVKSSTNIDFSIRNNNS